MLTAHNRPEIFRKTNRFKIPKKYSFNYLISEMSKLEKAKKGRRREGEERKREGNEEEKEERREKSGGENAPKERRNKV